uniref:ABC transmembrane type-1 domain-containing protein n=1 Tax=Arcella intermedia TaxID=1963864 RepID=A0A6B2L4W9_9EUKA
MNSLFTQGYLKPITQDDIPDIWKERDDPELSASRFEHYWNEEAKKPNPSLLKVLLLSSKKPLLYGGILCLIENIFRFTGPLLLEQIVLFIADHEAPLWQGIVLCVALFLGLIIQVVCGHHHYYQVTTAGLQMESALLRSIFKKALAMSTSSVRKTTVGEIVNHQSVDYYPIFNLFRFINAVWAAPLQIIGIFSLLGRLNGVSTLGVLAFFAFFFPMLVFANKKAFDIEKQLMKLRDERTSTMNELLQGILVVKFFAWEDSFLKKINGTRSKEISLLKRGIMYIMFTNVLWTVGPPLMSGCVFLIYLTDHKFLPSEVAFATIALINNLTIPLTNFPIFIGNFLQATVSLTRLTKFLSGEDLDPDSVQSRAHNGLVRIKNASFAWEDTNVLSDIDITFKKGHLK